MAQKPKLGNLVGFHTWHKYQLLTHSTKYYREMGRLVARAREMPLLEALAAHQDLAMTTLHLKATPKKHANVLQHLMGYFKKQFSSAEKQELLESIDSFRRGEIPLLAPLTLIKHYMQRFQASYLQEQFYLNPEPLEVLLRNHA